MVVAGSMSGALKVWDLEQAKSKRKAAIFITSFLPGSYCLLKCTNIDLDLQ